MVKFYAAVTTGTVALFFALRIFIIY